MIAFATWVGLIAGVALGGGGISVASPRRLCACTSRSSASPIGAVALAARRGQRAGGRWRSGVAAAVGLVGWLINGVRAAGRARSTWLKYVSPFYYYAGHDPLTQGVDVADLAVLGAIALAFTALAVATIERRDLRG